MEWDATHGQIREYLRASGRIILCRAKVYLLGQMAENILESTITIRKKGMANSFGLMEGSIPDIGLMESNKEMVYIELQKEKLKLENGMKVRE
jgi:hypothetical protein